MKSNVVPLSGPNWSRPDLSLVVCREAPAPKFPVELLGGEWANWCEANAASANAPIDYVGTSLITTGAALIGNARTASFAGWVQPSALWCVLVGPPSAKKSPAMAPLKRAVGHLEAELREMHDPESGPLPQLRIADVMSCPDRLVTEQPG